MRALLIILFMGLAQMLYGHGSHGSGVMAGVTHPILGLDHLLAIFSMALFAKIQYPEGAWQVIFSFVGVMMVGGLLGISANSFPLEELVIKGSVIVYGLLLVSRARIPIKAYALIGVVIGLFHGHAHGVEMPDSTEPIKYVPGFALGTIIISAFGEFVGRHMAADEVIRARVIGGLIVMGGVWQFLG